MSVKADYYELLEVQKQASDQELKSAYRRLALKYHPDRNPGDKAAEERFKQAAEAYSVLSDPEKRQRYDAYGHAGVQGTQGGFDPSAFSDFGDILGDFFGFGDIFGRRRGGPRRGADLRYNLELEFEQAAFGFETSLQFPRVEACATCEGSGSAPGTKPSRCSACAGTGQVTFQQGFFSVARTCGRCRGTGKVVTSQCVDCHGQGHVSRERKLQIKIPSGVDNGSQLRITGEGEAGSAGGPPGDLYVVVGVKEHAFFKRDGANLFCEVPVNIAQAALGTQVDVTGLDGTAVKIVVPAGSQTGESIRVRQQGVPHLGGKGRGDLHAFVRVVVPEKLTSEQRKLLEQLAKSLPSPQTKEKDRSVLDRMKDILG
jgi:molecular chaperone DnaJ